VISARKQGKGLGSNKPGNQSNKILNALER
jgi:hypothetical protein